MKASKVVSTLRDAIARSGLKNGGRISFHHHLRNGDGVMNMVLAELAAMGYKDLTLNSSSVFDVQSPIPLAAPVMTAVLFSKRLI